MATRSKELTEALSALIAQQPFFAVYLIDQMEIVEDAAIPTAATNGKTIYVGTDWFPKLTVSERIFVLAHEVMHGIMQHMQRAKTYADRGVGPDFKEFSHKRFNKAADYIINPLLKESNVGTMPMDGLYHPDIGSDDLVDEVYDRVPEDDDDGGQGSGFDEHMEPPPGTPPPSDAEVKRALKSAANAAKAQGNLPAGLKRMVDKLVEPQSDWKQLLRRCIEGGLGKDTVTWAKPNRRRMAVPPHIYMPGYMGYRSGKVGVVIDTSGSISDKEISVFLSEVSGIMSDGMPEECQVLWTDSEVAGIDVVEHADELMHLDAKGGGGTDMRVGIDRAIEEMGSDDLTVVILTDMYTPFHDDPPPVECIWVSTTKDMEAPYGSTIYVNIDSDNH